MAEIKIVLKRVNEKGYIKFELPHEIELQESLRSILKVCRDKYNDYVSVTFKSPYKPRTTGKGSQNHKLNGMIMQICSETGNEYETVKYCIKMKAVETMGYPYETLNGYVVPKGERNCNTEECAKLIEAGYIIASEMGIILREEAE